MGRHLLWQAFERASPSHCRVGPLWVVFISVHVSKHEEARFEEDFLPGLQRLRGLFYTDLVSAPR